jgi:hypothetical protein
MRVTSTLKNILGPSQSAGLSDGAPSVTIRYARSDDALALMELAYLDSSRAPEGVVIVAEVGGRLWAARSLDDGHAIADPFRPSGELSFLLAERARQVEAAVPERRERRVHRALAA